jgi:hypothetical protein
VDDPEKLYRLRRRETHQAKKLDFLDSESKDKGSQESPKNSPPQSPRENRLPPMGDQPPQERLRRASGCLGMSRGSSRGSSLTTSTTSRVQLPRHVARLVTRLVVNYSASRRLVIDYFAYATHPGALARRMARHAARRRLLRLRRASSCFGTSHGLSRDSSSTTSPRAGSSSTTSPTPRVRVPRHVARLFTRLVVDYFTYAARPVASARRAACRVTHRRLLCLAQARRRLLRLRRTFGCLDTSRGSSRGTSSTTSPTSRVRLLRHVARLVA